MKTYIVKSGDTLSGVARRFGIALTELLRANRQIADPNRIFPGQRINIPGDGSRAEQDRTVACPVNRPPTASDSAHLTVQQLIDIVPTLSQAKASTLIDAINQAMQEAHITTPQRKAAFLAQIAHETGGFRWFRELGSDAYFQRYDSRVDLGNTRPGDGPRFRGRGFIQITGRTNYEKAGAALGLDLLNDPGLAETPNVAARIAAWFWQSRDLNTYADREDFITITRRINGGLNGLADREAYYERAKKVLGVA